MTMSKISISKATISSKLFHNLFQAVTTRGGFLWPKYLHDGLHNGLHNGLFYL